MDMMEEKHVIAVNLGDCCFQQRRRDVVILPRYRSTGCLASSRSTLGLNIVWMLLLVLCIFVCFLTLSAVFVLSNKVQTLEARLDELIKHKGQSNTDSSSTFPTFQQIRNDQLQNENVAEVTDSVNKIDEQPGKRISRQSPDANHQYPHTFSHLTGRAENTNCTGRWVSWHTPTERIYRDLATDNLNMQRNTFLPIHQPGWYYIYGQLTYHSTQHAHPHGFEIVQINCQGHKSVLLEAQTTQITLHEQDGHTLYPATDSSYIGGVFFLKSYDLIAIRMKHRSDVSLLESDIDTHNFFGAFKLGSQINPPLSTCTGTSADSLCS